VLRRDGTGESYMSVGEHEPVLYTDILAISGGVYSQTVIKKDGSVLLYKDGVQVTDIPQINLFKHQMVGESVNTENETYVKIHINDISTNPATSARLYGSPGFGKPLTADDFVVDVIKGSQSFLGASIAS
ncbi:MAG TPA: hypothetical protein DDZ89_14695, partial [Clostridiales bacterium]|nr:hypothetical protein [Clostridiales bacterium]